MQGWAQLSIYRHKLNNTWLDIVDFVKVAQHKGGIILP